MALRIWAAGASLNNNHERIVMRGLTSLFATLCIAASVDAAFIASTSDSQFDPGLDNQGALAPNLPSSTSNANYFAGQQGSTAFRNYFIFDLTSLDSEATSATLELRRYFSDAGTVMNFYDVSTSAAELISTRADQNVVYAAAYADLGTGTMYGSQAVGPGNPDDIFSIVLNASAIADINAAAGGFFAIGTQVDTVDPLSGSVFSGSGSEGVQRLVIETKSSAVPEPSTMAVWLLLFAIFASSYRSRTRSRNRVDSLSI